MCADIISSHRIMNVNLKSYQSTVAFFVALLATCLPPTVFSISRNTFQAQDSVLRIGIKVVPPFVMKSESGEWTGISIELWRLKAKDLNLRYEFHESDLNGILHGVKEGKLDAAIAAISVTADREKLVDFSQPYFNSGLGIAVKPSSNLTWFDALKRIVTTDVIRLFVLLTFSTLLMGTVMWLLERNKNESDFGEGKWTNGLGDGLWWSVVTLTTVGYGDITPKTLPGRIVALVWMISGIVMVASFTATMTSTLTVARLESEITNQQDLYKFNAGCVSWSTSVEYFNSHKLFAREFIQPSDGLKEVSLGKLDAMVYDAPMLRYWILHNHLDELTVLPCTFEKQNYAIALVQGSMWRKPFNQSILRMTRSEHWDETLAKYLGSQ